MNDLIRKNRSYRRFYQEVKIGKSEILNFIDLARLSPSARNAQPMKYFISSNEEKNELIFATLSWAGYLKDW
ncbi:MAG: nitroreductase family protein, partial [Bacteroidota bacterium]|nr:nitroreductase family protein [Bacteroidota bacterium]